MATSEVARVEASAALCSATLQSSNIATGRSQKARAGYPFGVVVSLITPPHKGARKITRGTRAVARIARKATRIKVRGVRGVKEVIEVREVSLV